MSIHYCPCGMPRTPEACVADGIAFPSVEWEEEHLSLHLTAFPNSPEHVRTYLQHRVDHAKELLVKQDEWDETHTHAHIRRSTVVVITT